MGVAAVAAGCLSGKSTGGAGPNGAPMQGFRVKPMKRIRLGVVGLGQRGDVAMPRLAVLPGVEIVALCDIYPERVAYQQKFLREHGYPTAKHEFSGPEGYKRLCNLDIDLVYNTTDWAHHAEVALYAMRHGKHVFTEVPAVTGVDESWEMVETAEKTRLHCMMLENACYGANELLYLNLCRLGKIGELVHAEWAYIHDLRDGCCHYGTRTGNDWNFARFRETFGDELNEAGTSIDLMLCGHEHYYARNDAHSTEIHHNFKYDSDRQKAKPPQFKYLSDKWNFTEVCGGLGEGACLEIKGRELTFTSFDWKQPGQPPLDRFTLKK